MEGMGSGGDSRSLTARRKIRPWGARARVLPMQVSEWTGKDANEGIRRMKWSLEAGIWGGSMKLDKLYLHGCSSRLFDSQVVE